MEIDGIMPESAFDKPTPILEEARHLEHLGRAICHQIDKARLDLPITVRTQSAIVEVSGSYTQKVVTLKFETA